MRGVRRRIECQMGGTGPRATAYRTLRRNVIEDVPAKSGCEWTRAHVLACALEGAATGAHGRWIIPSKTCFEKAGHQGWTLLAKTVGMRVRVTSRRAGGLGEYNQLLDRSSLACVCSRAKLPRDNMLLCKLPPSCKWQQIPYADTMSRDAGTSCTTSYFQL